MYAPLHHYSIGLGLIHINGTLSIHHMHDQIRSLSEILKSSQHHFIFPPNFNPVRRKKSQPLSDELYISVERLKE